MHEENGTFFIISMRSLVEIHNTLLYKLFDAQHFLHAPKGSLSRFDSIKSYVVSCQSQLNLLGQCPAWPGLHHFQLVVVVLVFDVLVLVAAAPAVVAAVVALAAVVDVLTTVEQIAGVLRMEVVVEKR